MKLGFRYRTTLFALGFCLALISMGIEARAAESPGRLRVEIVPAGTICGTLASNEKLEAICPLPARNITARADNFFKSQLSVERINKETLCSIESLLERAALYCGQGTYGQNHSDIANLMRLTAGKWREIKEFGKANAAYQRAFGLRSWEEHPNWRITLLQKWAVSKLDSGDSWGAKELADDQVALAEKNLQKNAPARIDTNAMIRALRFQGDIYEVIGLTQRAAEIRKRADGIKAKMPE